VAFRSGIVVVLGATNTGKSTLVNALVGEKISIVSEKPQTTRLKTSAVLHLPDAQVVFVDTPGIVNPRLPVEQSLVNTAFQALPGADLVLFLIDATKGMGNWESLALKKLSSLSIPVFLLINKIDLIPENQWVAHEKSLSAFFPFQKTFLISALKGIHLHLLLQEIQSVLPEGPPYFPVGMKTDLPLPLQIAEIIREKVFELTKEEIPHSTAVMDVNAEDRGERMYISAILAVEQASQKKILIGKGGVMLKAIGSSARKDIEKLVGKPIYLELWVKVKKKWRQREDLLRSLGYQ